MKALILLLFGAFLVNLAMGVRVFAEVVLKPTPLILVTDIDDSIKVSHVLDPKDALINAARTENRIRGFPELFQILIGRYPQMPMIYLTNAPQFIMLRSHTKFVEVNGFPEGMMLLRKNVLDQDHKISRLREILRATQPRVLILVGDNGEGDVAVYEQIRKEYPAVMMLTYIHQLYYTQNKDERGQALRAGQVGYVTPIEIALDLAAKNLIPLQQVKGMIDLIVPKILRTANFEDSQGRGGELSFPMWKDCRDFHWPPGLDHMAQEAQREGLLNALKLRIQTRCSQPGRSVLR
jgi:hypothetical protein